MTVYPVDEGGNGGNPLLHLPRIGPHFDGPMTASAGPADGTVSPTEAVRRGLHNHHSERGGAAVLRTATPPHRGGFPDRWPREGRDR